MTDLKLRIALAATAGLLPGLVVGFLAAPEDPLATRSDSATSQLNRIEEPAVANEEEAQEQVAGTRRTTDEVERVPGSRLSDANSDRTAEWTLVDELKALLASGRIETMAGQDQQNLRALLVRLHVQLGDAPGALALIESFEGLDSEQRIGLYDQLLNLASADYPEIAALAAERAMRVYIEGLDGTTPPTFSYPYDHYLTQLRTLDPHRSLELLAELRALGMEDGITLTLFEIEALAAAGRTGQALALAQALIDDPETLMQGLDALAKVDPVQGEAELRKQLEGPHANWARTKLISMLTGQGRPLEAIEMFEGALANGTADAFMWSQLLNGVPRKFVDAMLDDWLAAGDADFGALQSIANYYQSQGDTWATLDAYEQLWAKALESGAWLQQLPWEVIKAHPTEALALLDMAAGQVGDNDEMWGDLADTYWQAGATNEAIAAWETAMNLDPNDSEWTNKLDAAANGQSPIWIQPDSQLGDVADLYPQDVEFDILGGGSNGFPGQSGWLGDFGYGSDVFFENSSMLEFSGVSAGVSLDVGATFMSPGGIQVFGGVAMPPSFPPEEIEILEELGYGDGE